MIVVVVMMMREERRSTIPIHQGVHTGDLDQAVTSQKGSNLFSPQKRKLKRETCLYHGVDAATDVGGNHQTNTSLLGHMNRTEEGRANG